MATNTGAIRDLLLPGLREVYGDYDMIPNEWTGVFQEVSSDKAFERSVEMRYLGYAQIKPEGAQTAFDNTAGENVIYNQAHTVVALGYAITEETIEDNQYKSSFKPTALGLKSSFMATKNSFAADILNTATTYNQAIGGDSQPLCSTAHPVAGSLVANRPTIDVDLNEATLLSAQIAIQTNFKTPSGLKINAGANMLIVPPQLGPTAYRLVNSELRPGTSDNDINVIKMVSTGIPGGVKVMRYLTSPFAWFLTTDVKEGGLVYFKRRPFRIDMDTDFTTNNLLVKGSERYSFSYTNYRGIYGSFPTS